MAKAEYHGITVDLDRDKLFDSLGIQRLKESYMKEEEGSPQERFAFVSSKFSSNPEHAQRLYEYSSKHWLSYSTPILSFGRSKRGMPISCFLNYIDDTAEGLVENLSETNWLSMLGGGVGIGFGIRSSDDKSTGVMPHLKTYDASCLAYRQGRTRRGSYATYLDISHPDVLMFLEMRKPTGDPNMRCLNLHHGINITDNFMKIVERCMTDPNADDGWNWNLEMSAEHWENTHPTAQGPAYNDGSNASYITLKIPSGSIANGTSYKDAFKQMFYLGGQSPPSGYSGYLTNKGFSLETVGGAPVKVFSSTSGESCPKVTFSSAPENNAVIAIRTY